jgi:hypothetical protein
MQNYYVAFKAEPVSIGVPDVTVTGAAKMRLNEFTAPELARNLITPGEIKSNGQSPRGRPGTHEARGTLPADLYYGEHDTALEAAMRGTWSSNVLVPGTTRRSYTIEVYEQDLDASVLTKGWRFGGFRISGAPDEPVRIEYPGLGITQEVLASGSSPFYTTPSLTTTEYMDTLSCVIEVDGVAVLDLTSFDFTFDLGLSTARVVGSPLSPDVYENNATLAGTLTALRTSTARQAAYIAGTDFDCVITAEDPAGNQMVFTFTNLLATGFTLPLGNAGPPVSTLPVVGGQVGSTNMVEIERVAAV